MKYKYRQMFRHFDRIFNCSLCVINNIATLFDVIYEKSMLYFETLSEIVARKFIIEKFNTHNLYVEKWYQNLC